MTTNLLPQTPSQTVGPYFAYGLTPQQYDFSYTSAYLPVLAQPHTPGQHIRIIGQVFDGAGDAVGDAMIEISQLDASGKAIVTQADVDANGFKGFGRVGTGTDAQKHFIFETVKPGMGEAGDAPFINVIVLMRGLLVHAFTRIYFSDEAANATDPVLASVPAERRATLIAQRQDQPGGVVYRFDIHMQGDQETVFFDL